MNVSEMNGEKCIEFSSRCFQCNAICWTFSSVLGLERDRNQTAQDVQSPWSKRVGASGFRFHSFSQMQFVTCTCLFQMSVFWNDSFLREGSFRQFQF